MELYQPESVMFTLSQLQRNGILHMPVIPRCSTFQTETDAEAGS